MFLVVTVRKSSQFERLDCYLFYRALCGLWKGLSMFSFLWPCVCISFCELLIQAFGPHLFWHVDLFLVII